MDSKNDVRMKSTLFDVIGYLNQSLQNRIEQYYDVCKLLCLNTTCTAFQHGYSSVRVRQKVRPLLAQGAIFANAIDGDLFKGKDECFS